MELDKIFETFVNPQTIIVCLAIYLATYVIRKIVEGAWKNATDNRLWREVWLPIGPIVNGALIGLFAKTFVWPEFIGTSAAGRIMYGAICGVFSALIYGRIRSWVQSAPVKFNTTAKEKAPEPLPVPGAQDRLQAINDLPPEPMTQPSPEELNGVPVDNTPPLDSPPS